MTGQCAKTFSVAHCSCNQDTEEHLEHIRFSVHQNILAKLHVCKSCSPLFASREIFKNDTSCIITHSTKPRVSLPFSTGGQLIFTGRKTFWTEILYNKTFPVDGQTRWTKSSLQPLNLPGAWCPALNETPDKTPNTCTKVLSGPEGTQASKSAHNHKHRVRKGRRWLAFHYLKEKISIYQCNCCFWFLGLALVQGELNKSHILHLKRKNVNFCTCQCTENPT